MADAHPTEHWRPINGWEGRYEVSDLGRVRSPRGIIAPYRLKIGYLAVNLWRDNRSARHYVHQLVAEGFHGARPDGAVVRHLDGSRDNNWAANLAWGTVSENGYDRVKHGNHFAANKAHCPRGHSYSDPKHLYRRPGGRRSCRTCANDAKQARRRAAPKAAA